MPGGHRKIKHAPDECAPDKRPLLDRRPRRFVNFRLPFFGMPRAAWFGLLRVLLVLRGFAPAPYSLTQNPPCRLVFAAVVELAAVILLGAAIPAGINVPAEQVGILFICGRASVMVASIVGRVGSSPCATAARSCSSRCGSSLRRTDFVAQAPDKNRGVIDVLPDEIQQLVARGVFKFRRVADDVDLRNFRPDQNARLGRRGCKNNRCAGNARSA